MSLGNQFFMVIDIETSDRFCQDIFAIGGMICKVSKFEKSEISEIEKSSKLEVIDTFEWYKNTKECKFDDETKKFWDTQDDAKNIINRLADSKNWGELSVEFTKWVNRSHKRFSNLEIVSDNPSFDIGMGANKILRKQNDVPINFGWNNIYKNRRKGYYHDIVCLDTLTMFFPEGEIEVKYGEYIRHTPLFDCYKMALYYFKYINSQ